jgi:prepilin-type N-terminal cleavage/methylation domain-containing protein/prepilin-type processing-associated H-X9-DG protein
LEAFFWYNTLSTVCGYFRGFACNLLIRIIGYKPRLKDSFVRKNRKTGFTLVELLVVISIIALLMGVLIPALSAARGRAQTIVCGANLKSYGYALIMYADSNRDKAPFSFSWLYSMKTILDDDDSGACRQECRWHYDVDKPDGTLWPYLQNIKAHMCPTFKAYAKITTCELADTHPVGMPYNPTYSYSMNRWLGLYCLPLYKTNDDAVKAKLLVPEPSLMLTRVKRTAQCFAFSEENMWTVGIRPSDGGKLYSRTGIGKNDLWLYALANNSTDLELRKKAEANFATYHNVSSGKRNEGYANAVFVDGHVTTVKGLPGYDAYLEFGRPYIGHEQLNIW